MVPSTLADNGIAQSGSTQMRLVGSCSAAYDEMPLVELVTRIVQNSDAEALQELHDQRSVFHLNEGGPLLLAEYVDALHRASINKEGFDVARRAYDKTIDRFFSMPKQNSGNGGVNGTDCRKYYKAFLKAVERSEKLSPLEAEIASGILLQGMVTRHFRFAVADARRTCGWTRYTWRVGGGTITVLMPRQIAGKARRAWLEENISDVDPYRPGEKERVQRIISQQLNGAVQRFIDGAATNHADSIGQSECVWSLMTPSAEGLARTVAEEKSALCHMQRPAIRRLGPATLKSLVLRILDDICSDTYCEARIAREFDISKATFSRFAGSRWQDSEGEVPDLWRNMAQVLAADPVFVEIAMESGVWSVVQSLTKNPAVQGGM